MVQQGTVDKHITSQREHVEKRSFEVPLPSACEFDCLSIRLHPFLCLLKIDHTKRSPCSRHPSQKYSRTNHILTSIVKKQNAGCPPVSPRGVLALCLQTDKDQRDLVFWSTLKAQRPGSDSRWLMEAQRKGPLRNREALNERSAQKDSRLTIGWLNAKLRASNKRCEFTPQWRRSSEGQTYM